MWTVAFRSLSCVRTLSRARALWVTASCRAIGGKRRWKEFRNAFRGAESPSRRRLKYVLASKVGGTGGGPSGGTQQISLVAVRPPGPVGSAAHGRADSG